MSLKAHTICPVPGETARIARAAYPRGNMYMQMRDVLGSIYTDEDFAELFPKEGQPAEAPWRLALVTVMQFVENLSDRQAADAVRGRIDWKYLLSLELTDEGFDASVLSEFRARLIDQHAEELLLEKMLTLFGQKGWLKARGRQRTDSTHVLAKIRALNRVLCVWETMRAALNSLAVAAPEWLRAHSRSEWVERYGPRSEDSRSPLGEAERLAFAEEIGQQGRELLDALFDPAAPQWLRLVPAVEILRQVWVQNYQRVDEVVRWRSSEDIPPPSRYIGSPYDEEAHYSKKRSLTWVGYKVHLTESCEAHLPLIVTHVETTSAPVSDDAMTATIHAQLDRKELLPAEHLVDTGYVDAKLLVESQRDYQIDLVGPTRKNYRWQATQKTGFDVSHFPINWEQQQATCPEGHTSISWTPAIDNRKNEVIKIKFSTTDCQVCPSRSLCTQSIRHTRRTVTIRPEVQYQALKVRREQEQTKEFQQVYAKRAGIEGTISQAVRTMGMRRSRYIGQEKTHLQHIATAAALNVVRSMAWFSELPRAQTRRSAFTRLYDAL
jgi:transposase